jgi:hypothetical protein
MATYRTTITNSKWLNGSKLSGTIIAEYDSAGRMTKLISAHFNSGIFVPGFNDDDIYYKYSGYRDNALIKYGYGWNGSGNIFQLTSPSGANLMILLAGTPSKQTLSLKSTSYMTSYSTSVLSTLSAYKLGSSGQTTTTTYGRTVSHQKSASEVPVTGTDGDDVLYVSGFDDATVDGKGGHDMVAVLLPRMMVSEAEHSEAVDKVLVLPLNAELVLKSVEEIHFLDGTLTVDTGAWKADPQAASVARLYYTTLDRPPDAAGLLYWTMNLEQGKITLEQIAVTFAAGEEFTSRYGTLNNTNFVQRLYQNTLGREGEAAGVNYWVSNLDAGATRSLVVTCFSESSELRLQLAPVTEQEGVYLA